MFRTAYRKAASPIGMVAVLVTKPASCPSHAQLADAPKPAHHKDGAFVNPWPSFHDVPRSLTTMYHMWQDWVSHPVPAPELLPQVVKPDWGVKTNASPEDLAKWRTDIKSTWLGHACFLVELPAPEGSTGRGPRILYDPVFSNRCSPSQYVGPARVTKPPIELEDLPEVDAVILSHNHYDHTDVATLKHIYKTQEKGSCHFFAPLGNAKWFHSLGFDKEHVTELDWWHERDISITLPGNGDKEVKSDVRVTCTPCQHFTGRSIHDHYKTLWASWAVQQLPSATSPYTNKLWFAGDTGYKSVPRGATTEEGLPTCPAFAEIGEKFGGFDFSFIPIGAYDPRWAMARVHCNPEDAVELHLHVKSKKSIAMHHSTWVLTCEEMTEPPKRLRAACKARGIPEGEFTISDIGETWRIASSTAGKDTAVPNA